MVSKMKYFQSVLAVSIFLDDQSLVGRQYGDVLFSFNFIFFCDGANSGHELFSGERIKAKRFEISGKIFSIKDFREMICRSIYRR